MFGKRHKTKKAQRERAEKGIGTVILSIESANCLTQHMQAFLDQSGERKANFGEPCADCPYAESCEYDWYGKMKPLFEQSDVKFRLCRKAK